MNNILEIRNLVIELSKDREKTVIVNDMTLSVGKGEVLAIVGESGSGKSMTCLSVCGILPDTMRIVSGEILFEGKRIDNADREDVRRLRGNKISLIMQNPISCFNPLNDIKSHFKETLLSHDIPFSKENREKILDFLKEVGFDNPDELSKKYPFQLSGGMLQSIMISIALFFDSSLIIADEPTTDLDIITQAKILEMLDTVRKKRNCAVIFVTHDLTAASKLSDRMMIMKDGAVCDSGNFEKLRNRPAHEYTSKLFDAFDKLNAGIMRRNKEKNIWN